MISVKTSLLMFALPLFRADLVHTFKSPSFNGINASAHFLTIDEQERTRRQKVADEIEDRLKEIEREANNTNLSKFLRNLESRIYSQLSRDLADSLFNSEEGGRGGTFELEGNLITFENTGTEIVLIIIDQDGVRTELRIPIGSFGICSLEECDS